jgi:FtsZ-binding cell division protein ZapB
MGITTVRAIKLLSLDIEEMGERKEKELRAAQKLGIESLKRHRDTERALPKGMVKLLPGEVAEN